MKITPRKSFKKLTVRIFLMEMSLRGAFSSVHVSSPLLSGGRDPTSPWVVSDPSPGSVIPKTRLWHLLSAKLPGTFS